MNKEQIQQAAKEFCEKNIPIVGSDHMIHANVQGTNQVLDLHLFLSGFLQSMIEKGEVVDPVTAMDIISENRRLAAENNELLVRLEKSTVSSAGKEVKTLQELRDKIAVEEYGKEDFEDLFWAWSDMEGNDGYNGISKVYDAAAEMYANQFKSQPALKIAEVSDQEIESAGKEVKSAKEIIEKYGWHVGDRSSIIPAMEEYADQFKTSPARVVISDQEIADLFFDIATVQDEYGNSVIRYEDFVKWYREQLNKKP